MISVLGVLFVLLAAMALPLSAAKAAPEGDLMALGLNEHAADGPQPAAQPGTGDSPNLALLIAFNMMLAALLMTILTKRRTKA